MVRALTLDLKMKVMDTKFCNLFRIWMVAVLTGIFVGCSSPTPTTKEGDGSIYGEGSEEGVAGTEEGSMGGGAEKSRPEIRDGVAWSKFSPIHFDYDSAVIRKDDRGVLEEIAQWMKENPDKKVMIAGHCDERGTLEYNRALGQRRALAAREYLVKLGASAGSLSTISYGEEQPVEQGHTEDAWSRNRRDEFGVIQ